MLQLRALSLGLFFIFFSACGITTSLNPKSIVSGNNWVLYSLAGKEIDKGKFGIELPSLDFLDGERLAGFSGCNNFSGEYQLQGANIQLSSGAMTKKSCPGTGEPEFISALERVKNFTVGKEKLTLLDGSTELMSFIPKKD
jgi:heat shock protein HslJ